MKKIFRKAITFLLSSILTLSLASALVACNGEKPDGKNKVMNLSLNPSVEFVLDGNNKVVSVSANNDEGNFVIANATFIGLSAEDASDLFLQVVKDNGFLIESNVTVDENTLSIEVSGDNAQKIYDSVKSSVEDKMNDLSITVHFDEFEKISKEDIEELIEECYREIDEEDIEQMSEEELLNKLKATREETKEFLSEELKDYYYQARYNEILKAKFDKIEELVNQLPDIFSIIKSTFSTQKERLISALDSLNASYESMFLAQDSAYRVAMTEFITAKKALLESRLEEFDATTKAEIENALSLAENALVSAKATVDAIINASVLTIESTLTAIEGALSSVLSSLDMTSVDTAIDTAKNDFNAQFKLEFSVEISDVYWNDLKPSEAE